MTEKYVLTLDATQLNAIGKCELMWAYDAREHLKLTPIWEVTKASALDKGTLVHLILEAFYKAKLKYTDEDRYSHAKRAIEAFYKHKLVTESYFTHEEMKFIQTRFIEYVNYWAGRDLEPVSSNGVPGVELGFSKILFENDKVLFIVEGKIDLVNDFGSDIIGITDHKSQDRMNNLYPFSPQMLTYTWASGFNQAQINYFGLQKELKSNVTFRREAFLIPDWMKQRWEQTMLSKFLYIYGQDKLGLSNEEAFRRNFSNCSGSFGSNPCQYTLLCETNNKEMLENLKNFKYERKELWQPWKQEENGIEV